MGFDALSSTQLSILLPALVAGCLVLSTHVPLGQDVLKRGIIFLDLAIAQVAALGLVFASVMGADEYLGEHAEDLGLWGSQGIAIVAAVAGASLLYTVRTLPARIQEALIGILFMLAATGSLLLLSKDPHSGEHLKDMLVGQILWVEYTDLISVFCIYAAILGLLFWRRDNIAGYVFYPVFAVTITLSTQLVGIYLVFASLIVPALSTQHLKNSLLAAYFVGGLGYVLGLLGSALFDLPSGPAIAWGLSLVGGLVFLCTYKWKKQPAESCDSTLPSEQP